MNKHTHIYIYMWDLNLSFMGFKIFRRENLSSLSRKLGATLLFDI